jgi:hypothetical protein
LASSKQKHARITFTYWYLSGVFGIEQNAARRAWCGAEANVGVCFKLKEQG